MKEDSSLPTAVAPPILHDGINVHQMLSIEQFSALRGISKDTTRREIRRAIFR
jgi:hypothetical protein